MKKNISKWTHFEVFGNLIAAYAWNFDYQDYTIKLITGVPKTEYYSCLNQAGLHFEEEIRPHLKNDYAVCG